MTTAQRELARHALGLPSRTRRTYRNHYVVGPGAPEHDDWLAMVAAGDARRHKPSALTGGDDCFTLTKAGAEAALARGERLDPEDFPA